MADRCYLSVCCRGMDGEALPGLFEKFLATAPFSSLSPGYLQIVLRAVDWAETPLIEEDWRESPLDPAGVLAEIRENLTADSCCEVETQWELWTFDPATSAWALSPQKLELACFGLDFDEGFWSEDGHFRAELGFEHLFTGDADPEAQSEDHAENREKTRDNIRRLERWMGQISRSLPVARMRLWSENEENLEARLDAILAPN